MNAYTTENFKERAFARHGDKYDYSLTVCNNCRDKVVILCPQHGEFTQIAYSHLQGKGCARCKIEKLAAINSFSKDQFINSCKKTHGDKYSYHLVDYKNSIDKVKIHCYRHGTFQQSPASHISGRGCPKCKSLDTERWIDKAVEAHGFRYDYSNVVYKNSYEKVSIGCFIHGLFEQTAGEHIYKNSGCPSCQINGFQKSRDGFLYVLKAENRMKIGITCDLKTRLKSLSNSTPFNFYLLFTVSGSGDKIFNLEKLLHRIFKNSQLSGFDGATEWFEYDEGVKQWQM